MSNPYISPSSEQNQPSSRDEIRAPATALMIVSIIALALGSLALIGDAFLLVIGNPGPLEILIRSIWGVVLLLASSFVLFGAIKMKNMTDYGLARAAAIVAMIPCIGPCCLLGIPFGIWAFTVLGKQHVRDAFR
jgi:hypothetical protein